MELAVPLRCSQSLVIGPYSGPLYTCMNLIHFNIILPPPSEVFRIIFFIATVSSKLNHPPSFVSKATKSVL
jgi:hypothetical protein